MTKSPCAKDICKVTADLLWPVQEAHLYLSYFLVQGSPQSEILKLEEFFRVFPIHASFLFAPRSFPRLVTLPSDLGLSSLGTHACLTSIRMYLPHLDFSPTQ